MKDRERRLEMGDVVQLSDDCGIFSHCFMVVTEPKSWGAQGYVLIPNQGQAYYRAEWENMEHIGKAKWVDE